MGNVATETLLSELKRLGAKMPPMLPLDGLLAASGEIARKYGTKVQ